MHPSGPTHPTQARCDQYTNAATYVAYLADPANSILVDGVRKPNAERLTAQQLAAAVADLGRVAKGVAQAPGAVLPGGVTPDAFAIDAALEFQQLLDVGFPPRVISYCIISGNSSGGEWAAINKRRIAVATVMKTDRPALAMVLERYLSLHATVCAIDRFWAELGHMYSPQRHRRRRLSLEKSDKMMLVRNTWRLEQGITSSDAEVETAFWMQTLEAEDE